MKGQVYKVQTDSFAVKLNNEILTVKARGLFKKNNQDIVVGDYVDVENGVISRVYERANRLIRPSVCNVDMVVLLISPQPKPDFYLIDKVLVNAMKEGIEVVFVINKIDSENTLLDQLSQYSHLGIKTYQVSAKLKVGVNELKEKLKNKLSVLVGQSAVGKTSLVNAMFNLNLKTGDLSSIGRGKHTTTRSEIFECEDIKVVDSPGFAVIDADVSLDEFPQCYPEYFEVSNDCKFRGCSHTSEPNCKVKELVEKGVYSLERYNRYVEIYKTIQERRKIYE